MRASRARAVNRVALARAAESIVAPAVLVCGWVALAVGASAMAGCGSAQPGGATTPDVSETAHVLAEMPPPDLLVGEDVTERFGAMNADSMRPPPSVFRHIELTPITGGLPQVVVSDEGWRVRLPSGAPVVTPTVHAGSVIVSGGFQSRQLYAFNAHSGAAQWGVNLGDDGPSTPACADGVCVFNTESCTIFAVDVETGEMLWSAYLGDPLMSAPSIADGTVYTSFPIRGGGTWPEGEDRPMPEGASHALGAFDLRTGAMKWARWIDAEIMSAPVLYRGRVYATTFGGTMFHFDAEDGALRQARVAMATGAPSIIDDALYFSRREDEGDESWERIVRSGHAAPAGVSSKPGGDDAPAAQTLRRRAQYLREEFQQDGAYMTDSAANDAANGFSGGAPAAANAQVALRLIGRATVHGLQEFQGSWVLGYNELNLVTMGEAIVAFDRQTGREAWVVPLPGDLTQLGGALGAPPARAGEHVVVTTTVGQVLVLDGGGEVQHRVETGATLRTQAVIEGGLVYVGSADGQLIAINTHDESITGWPSWAGNAARTGRTPN